MKRYKATVYVTAAAVCAAAAALLFRTRFAAEGASQGLALCLKVIIPSLFPFLVLSAFAVSVLPRVKKNGITDIITTRLFGLPGEAVLAILPGLTAGYPAGVKTAELLMHKGMLTRKQAARLCLFAVNSGAAFCVSATGGIMFSSVKIGVLLFISTACASIFLGMLQKPLCKDMPTHIEKSSDNPERSGVCDALVFSVDSAIKSTFSLCGWIVLFSSFGEILTQSVSHEALSSIITCVLEVTSAVAFAAQRGNTVLAAVCLGFSGFSVHCQLLPSLNALGVKYRHFFISRVLAGALSGVFAYILCKVFKVAVTVNAGAFLKPELSVSSAAAFALIFMCCVFILNLANSKKRCYNTHRTENKGAEYKHEAKSHWQGNYTEM